MNDTTVFFLRGINLGAKHKVPMAELRALAADLGAQDVRTHLQSGNLLGVVQDPPDFADRLAVVLEKKYGFAVPVVWRSAAELEPIAAASPFGDVADNPAREMVYFFSAEVDPGSRPDLDTSRGELLEWSPHELRVWFGSGVHTSRISLVKTERALGITATARNIRTIRAVLAKA